MIKKLYKKVIVNFRHTKSDRSATVSYGNYNRRLKKLFHNVLPFNKLKK